MRSAPSPNCFLRYREFQVSPSEELSSLQRKELKLYNAFSTVAVFGDEIVVVASKGASFSGTPDQTQTLDVLVSSNQTSIRANEDTPTQSSSVWDQKPAFASPAEPTISDAKILAGMNLTGKELKLHVDEYW